MAALCIVFLFFLSSTRVGESCKNDYSEHGFALIDHAYESIRVDRLISCYMACSMQPACQSLNYNLADKTCDLNNDTKYYRPKYFVEKPTFVYAENRDSESPWRRLNAATVCFGAKTRLASFKSSFLALSMLSNWFTSMERCPVEKRGLNGAVTRVGRNCAFS
ncbi:uncharacterized protein LOC141886644 [Acropora palmata]|uniref:uncharacterized protein LOC141886644 n=1 Tax=Acropora palmata TaxID=6131 RepID=UPI003DA05C7A